MIFDDEADGQDFIDVGQDWVPVVPSPRPVRPPSTVGLVARAIFGVAFTLVAIVVAFYVFLFILRAMAASVGYST